MRERFDTTHWSLVLAARTGQSPESRTALAALCEAYWFPVYAFIRRRGYSVEEARDLTQGYFTRLLERRDLTAVRPELGKFRSFLLASVSHFLSNELDRESAKKRSPGSPLLSLDAGLAEDRYGVEPVDALSPEKLFERKWATTVIERTRARLQGEWSEGPKARRYEVLRVHLGGEAAPPFRQIGESLGISEEAARVAVFRLRRRFGELLREEIADTVGERGEVEGEIRYLLEVLRT